MSETVVLIDPQQQISDDFSISKKPDPYHDFNRIMAITLQLLFIIISATILGMMPRWLNLGKFARIRDSQHALQLAFDYAYGLECEAALVDKDGRIAVAWDRGGKLVLIKVKGSEIAVLSIGRKFKSSMCDNSIKIETGSLRIGVIILSPMQGLRDWEHFMRNRHA